MQTYETDLEIIEQTGRSVRLNQIHAALQRLEDKGMVKSEMGNPPPNKVAAKNDCSSLRPASAGRGGATGEMCRGS